MEKTLKTDAYGRDIKILARIRLLGIFLFALGMVSAILVFRHPGTTPDEEVVGYESLGGMSVPITAANSKRYRAASESIGGKSMEAVADFKDGWSSLWRGRRLAYTLAVLGTGSAAVCFYLADFLSYPLAPPADRKPGTP